MVMKISTALDYSLNYSCTVGFVTTAEINSQ